MQFQFPKTIQDFINKHPELKPADAVRGFGEVVYYFNHNSLRLGLSLSGTKYKHMSFSNQILGGLFISKPADEQVIPMVKEFFRDTPYREISLNPKIRQFLDINIPKQLGESP